MGSSPSVPNIPSVADTSSLAQQYNTQAGTQSQQGTMVNQSNPYGSLNYTADSSSPSGYSANTSYSPQIQALFNQGVQGASAMGAASPTFSNAATSTLNYAPSQYAQASGTAGASNAMLGAGMGEIASGNYGSGNNINGQTSALTNQLMDSELQSLQPTFKMQSDWQNADLQNRGVMPGSEAYNNARYQTNLAQGNTMSDFLAKTQPQAYNEAVTGYSLPATIGESLINSGNSTGQLSQGYSNTGYGANTSATGLMGGAATGLQGNQTYTPSMSSTLTQTPSLNIQPANVNAATSTYDTAAMQQYQAQQSSQNAIYSALGSLGGAALGGWAQGGFKGLSNPEFKQNITPVQGEKLLAKLRRVKARHYRYTAAAQVIHGVPDGDRIGPMADDFAREFGGDSRTIDMFQMLGILTAAVQALEERTRHFAR